MRLQWTNILEKGQYVLLFNSIVNHICASTKENLSSGVCKQQRRRPACACVQSDQHLVIRLFESTITKLATSKTSVFLASLCSLAGWFENSLVGNPEDRFCHNEAHIWSNSILTYGTCKSE